MGFIPKEYKKYSTSIKKWLLTGLIIRLVLMVFTVHQDMLSSYIRSAKLVMNGDVAFSIISSIPHTIQAGWLYLIQHLMPTFEAFFTHPFNSLISNQEAFHVMLQDQYLNWYLFLMKFPYLILEIGVIALILYFFKAKPERGFTYLKYWLLCLPILYGVYMIGRYEMFGLILLLATLVLIYKDKPIHALFPLAALCFTRVFFAILIPFYIILLYKKNKKVAIKYLPWFAAAGVVGAFIFQDLILRLAASRFASFFLTFGLDNKFLPLFPIVYLVLIIAVLKIKSKESLFDQFCIYSLLTLSAFFIICFWHHQYFTWLMPFLLYFITTKKRLYLLLTIYGGYALYFLIFREQTTTIMLTAINYEYFATLSEQLFPKYRMLAVYIAMVGRLIISGALILLIYDIFKKNETLNRYNPIQIR